MTTLSLGICEDASSEFIIIRMSHVLVVDDEYGHRQLLRQALEQEGVSVLEAETIDDALAFAADPRLRPGLLLCDAESPGGRAFDLLRRLRESEPARPLRALLLTRNGAAPESVAAAVAAVGPRSVFVKGSDRAGLMRRVTELLAGPEGL